MIQYSQMGGLCTPTNRIGGNKETCSWTPIDDMILRNKFESVQVSAINDKSIKEENFSSFESKKNFEFEN
jgi:hypothetical protein